MTRLQERRGVLRSLLTLAAPTVAQQILGTLLQYVDTAMVGHLGPEATAAVSMSTSVNWLILSIPGAVAVGCLLRDKDAAADEYRAGCRSSDAGRQAMQTEMLLCHIGFLPPMLRGMLHRTGSRTAAAFADILR